MRESVMTRAQRTTLLPLMIQLTAIGYLLFFIPNLLLATTHRIHAVPAVKVAER